MYDNVKSLRALRCFLPYLLLRFCIVPVLYIILRRYTI